MSHYRPNYRWILPALLLSLAACGHNGAPHATSIEPVHLNAAPATDAERALPLVYWTEHPESLAVNVLRVDLHDKRLEVDAVIADDPDGAGPAEASLTNPLDLARHAHVLAAVNANAFASVADPTPAREPSWHLDMPVLIEGVAVHNGVARSVGPDKAAPDVVFGIDTHGQPYLGPAPSMTTLREGVNAWSFTMFRDGQVVPKPGGVRHPRTAVGLDASGRWLYIVVVDGRQPGYSIGVNPLELTNLMLRLGATRALNLDGGGSSIMLVADRTGEPQIINKPSGGSPRPVPVLLAVRRRD